MKLNLKKQLVGALAAVISIGSIGVNALAASMADVADLVAYVCSYVDTADYSAIRGAHRKATELKASSVSETAVAELMTDNFIKKFKNDNNTDVEAREAAKAAAVKLIAQGLGVYYSTTEAELVQNADDADVAIADEVYMVFGSNYNSADWLDMILTPKKLSQNIASYSDKRIWALGAVNEVFTTLDGLHVKALNNLLAEDSYADIKAILDDMDWTAEAIVKTARNIAPLTDANNIAEFALAKASARSAARLEKDGDIVDLSPAVSGFEENILQYSYDDVANGAVSNLSLYIVMGTETVDATDVTNLVGYQVSDKSVVTVTADEANKKIKLNLTGKRGVADVALVRQPEGARVDADGYSLVSEKDWLVRFRVQVLADIAQVNKPVWSDSKAGTLTWSPVEHASKYVVELYKDGQLVDLPFEVGNVTEYDFSDIIQETGEYTAVVRAYGAVEGEEGSPSEMSDPYDFVAALDKVELPVWNEKVLTWNPVQDATKYEVVIYDENKNIIHRETVTGATEFDATNVFKDEYSSGTFYATVQAMNDTAVGAPSLAAEIEIKAVATGKAYLQGVKTVTGFSEKVRANNGNIKISVAGYPAIKPTTSEDGSYKLEGLKDGTYTLTFSSQGYLTREMSVTIKNGVAQETAYLYYGDLNGVYSIDAGDINVISNIYSSTNDADMYADYDDSGVIGGDDVTALIINIGFSYSELD